MEKKEKESREEWFPSILFGLSMKIKESKYWIFVWIEEGKGKEKKRSSVNLQEKKWKNNLLKNLKLFQLI